MPTERQFQALNMSPRGISVDDSNVSSAPHLSKDPSTYVSVSSARQPSHFSRVINQNNLDFPVTCAYDNSIVHENFHISQASLKGGSLSRKRSFNQSYNPAVQPPPLAYNAYGELRVDIPTLNQENQLQSSSIPCSPHSWAANSHNYHQVFSIDDMGALRGPGYNFGGGSQPGMARSVSFGADSFPDQHYSMYSDPGYNSCQDKRASFQHNATISNPLILDQFSDSSGFSSFACHRGQRSPASERPCHMDQLNTSQFGSDISNVESVFSDVASYGQFSETHSMEVDSLKSPRDSYGANEDLRTSFSSGSQCSETVQRNDIFELLGGHPTSTASSSDRRLFYVCNDSDQQGSSGMSNWNHMDLAVGHQQHSLPAAHGYQTGALNALNLDGGFNDVDFDSILEDMDSFYRPHPQPGPSIAQEVQGDHEKSLTALPISTPNPQQNFLCNNQNSTSTMGRSCSLENILEDINKTVGASQNSVLDFLNLDAVPDSHESNMTTMQNAHEHTPKRVPSFQPSIPSSAGHPMTPVQQPRPHSQAMVNLQYDSNSRTPQHHDLYRQQSFSYQPSSHRSEFSALPMPNTNCEIFNNFTHYSGSDVISKSPKHKRWKLSVIDRTSRSPSLEDIPLAFSMQQKRHNSQTASFNAQSPLSMCTSTPITNATLSQSQKPSSVPGGPPITNRRPARPKTFSNPRMRSASNPNSIIIFSDEEELEFHETSSSSSPHGTVAYIAANRRCNSDASKRHLEGVGSHLKHASDHSLLDDNSGRDRQRPSHSHSGFASYNSRSSSCSSSSNHAQGEKATGTPPININISVINLITSDGGESVVPVKLSNVTSNVLSSVVADQTETATKIAKLFQDKGSLDVRSVAPNCSTAQKGFLSAQSSASSVADDHDYLSQNSGREQPEKPYKCSVLGCDKAFEGKSLLSRHIQDRHAVHLFRCPQCSKQFSRASNLKTHMCTFHKIVQFYLCSVPECQANFAFETDLKEHRRLHVMNDTFYVCPVSSCNFRIRFNDKSAMRTHLQTAHRDKLDGFGVEDLDRLLQNLTMHHLVNGRLIPVQS